MKLENLSKEQLLDLADGAGRKLGFLLATAPLDPESKDAILKMLENASPEQINLLTEVLEDGYLEAENESLKTFLKSDLASANAEYQSRSDLLEKETADKLSALLSR